MLAYDRSLRSLLPLLIAFALLLLVVASGVWLSFRQAAAAGWVRHTLEVENSLNVIRSLVSEAESAQRGFVIGGRERTLRHYRPTIDEIGRELAQLEQRIADNPAQERDFVELRAVTGVRLMQMARNIDLVRSGRSAQIIPLSRRDRAAELTDRQRAIIGRMRDTERLLLAERTSRTAWLTTLVQSVLVGGVLLTGIVAYWALRDGRRRVFALRSANADLQAQIADRETAEGQVRQLQKMEAIGQLTGGIAHDFNNMLAIVVGSLDIARRRLQGKDEANVGRYIDNAFEGAQRAATLTARLLAFSRQQPLEPKVLDSNKLVGNTSELLLRTIGEPVRIETVLAGGLWRICADGSQLESAIVNLAVNARDAMPNGGTLTIETANCHLDDAYARNHAEVTAGQYVMISLTDSGVGMTPEVIERAFDPFYTTKTVGKGTGLGLSQVFGFVKQSGGHLKIYSEVGHGTTVKIYLPRHTGPGAPEQPAAIAGVPLGRADEIVMVVEDEADVRHMSVDALRDLGYTVVQAAGPLQALEQLALQPEMTLLFTDIVMPDMNGRQLAERAVAERPGLKVLYTTGYTRNAVVHNGTLDQGVHFLAKPFTVAQLAVKVRDVLDG
jgi:signal transduction histidine kinase/CheY-like chemotaxis protein